MITNAEKQGFVGFKEVPNLAAEDVKSALGIFIDPSIKVYHFEPTNRLNRLRRLVAKTRYERPFLEKPSSDDTLYRGKFLERHKALLVRPGDIFAQYHELGHSFIHDQNPELLEQIDRGYKQKGEDFAQFAKFAFDEGAAQWIAINTGLKSGDSDIQAKALREHNRLIGKSDDMKQLDYDRSKVLEKLAQVRAAAKSYVEDPVVAKGVDEEAMLKRYENVLVHIARQAIAIGYVYTEALMRTFKAQPDFSTAKALQLVAKRQPSSLDQIGKEIETFSGFGQ